MSAALGGLRAGEPEAATRRDNARVPDRIDIDLAQTLLLLVTTVVAGFGALLAWRTYQGERDARRDALIERRLELIATRITELYAVSALEFTVADTPAKWRAARNNLESALALAPPEARLHDVRLLLQASPEQIADDNARRAHHAPAQLNEELRRLTGESGSD